MGTKLLYEVCPTCGDAIASRFDRTIAPIAPPADSAIDLHHGWIRSDTCVDHPNLLMVQSTYDKRHAQDDDIKLWDMELQPGETAPLHEHEYSYVFTVMVRASWLLPLYV